jgi:uncharacterized MAPEG superfamily protein
MSATGCALLGFVAWSVLLTFALLFVRFRAMGRGHPVNTFAPEGTDLDAVGRRVTRAHANSLENLAIVASLLLYALASGQTAITDGLAAVVFGARVVQSLAHIASGSTPAVLIRATGFGVQMVVALIWVWHFWQAGIAASAG